MYSTQHLPYITMISKKKLHRFQGVNLCVGLKLHNQLLPSQSMPVDENMNTALKKALHVNTWRVGIRIYCI